MKSHRVVILGVDGVGKTTLCKALAKEIQGIYHKDTCYKEYFFGNPDYTWHASFALMQLIPQVDHSLVFDRFFHDEYVYGKVMHRSFNELYFVLLLKMCKEQNFKVVYLHRKDVRVDELIDSKFIPELRAAYQALFFNYNLDWIALNSELPITEQVSEVVKYLNPNL